MSSEPNRVVCRYCGVRIPEHNAVIHEARCERMAGRHHTASYIDIADNIDPSIVDISQNESPSPVQPMVSNSLRNMSRNSNTSPPDPLASCPNCTYMNDSNAAVCAMCQSSLKGNVAPRPVEIIDISDDSESPAAQMPSDVASCPNCTYLNNSDASTCAMCQSPLSARREPSSSCITCPRCTYAENAPNSNFCSMCSAPLRPIQRQPPSQRSSILTGAVVGGAVGMGLSYIRGGNPIAGAVAGAGVGALAGSLYEEDTAIPASPPRRNNRHHRGHSRPCRRVRHPFDDEDDFFPFQDMMMPFPGEAFYQMVIQGYNVQQDENLQDMSYEEMLQRFPGNVPQPADSYTIRSLPSYTIQENQPSSNCSICLCDFQPGEEAKRLHCLHSFHSNCIDTWLQQSGTCPICKTKI